MLDERGSDPHGIRSVSMPEEYRLREARAAPRRLQAGGIGHAAVWRQLELARADLDAHERPHHPRSPALRVYGENFTIECRPDRPSMNSTGGEEIDGG
jgi:hypothetical protein